MGIRVGIAPDASDGLRAVLRETGAAAVEGLPGSNRVEADCLVLEQPVASALDAGRRAHASDPAVQLVILVRAEERRAAERALLFTPGLGEVWLVDPADLNTGVLERASEVTRKRRGYTDLKRRVAGEMARLEPPPRERSRVSDAYLATLLQVLPDAVLSVDDDGTILSWNPAVEAVLGRTGPEVAGRNIGTVLSPESAESIRRAVADDPSGTVTLETAFRTGSGEDRLAAVIAKPLEIKGESVRVVIVRDITEARRGQEALEEQAAELEAQSSQLQEQASELEKLNSELRGRSESLEAALSAKAQFYAAMSHELRTPMNAIMGYNALLLDELYGSLEPAQADAVRRVQRAAKHLLELLNDVLDLAKIEAGRLEMNPEDVHFPALLEELADTVRPLAEEQGSSLEVESPAGEHQVVSDPRRIRQILLNLLSNAVKFGESRPIRVIWKPEPDGGVRVEVIDQGRGIAPADQERIFEEFIQIAADGVGTGLGLPISRRLTEALGGRLEIRSNVGEGSTFSLVLPRELSRETAIIPRGEAFDQTTIERRG